MTLQYRIRSKKYEDDRWRERIRLCEQMLLYCLDSWCRDDSQFPMNGFIASTLFLFSPRCDPDTTRESQLRSRIAVDVDPRNEYVATWPSRALSEADALVAALSETVSSALRIWGTDGIRGLSVEAVAERLVKQIVTQQYVVFHRTETTRRDVNHWGI